jgi:beta-aspartyl-peptidase (threonine type)
MFQIGRFRPLLCFLVVPALALACSAEPVADRSRGDSPALDWSIAIHGGAGSLGSDAPDAVRDGYLQGLETALTAGRDLLEGGASALDAVEQVIAILEDDARFNAGRGAVFNAAGGHELDASIMDGATLAGGGVAGVRTVKNPIRLARAVMEQTRHVLLAGPGAEAFADTVGVERVEPSYFDTDDRRRSLERKLEESVKGTVGVVALDRNGNLAAGTSTGGLTAKMYGRVGDSPIIGAGTYADNRRCAVSGTGVGEEYIRNSVAYAIGALMEYGGLNLAAAVDRVIDETLKPGDGGIIAMDPSGSIAMRFNTASMLRGAADSSGRFDVKIWE